MTKIDYSQLSDFEINKRVAHTLGNPDVGRPFDEISGTACQFTVFKNTGLNREGEIVTRPMTVTKDFCNNWSDAGPIIVEHRINIEWHEWKNGIFRPYALNNETMKSCYDTNPLRAAMIVFLEMQ